MPSEKHLEDWTCEHEVPFLDEIVGRQIWVPHGRLDLIGVSESDQAYGSMVIVELKARAIKEQDLGQVLRYKYDVLHMVEDALVISLSECPIPPENALRRELWREGRNVVFAPHLASYPLIPVLVGTCIDEGTLAACGAAGINIWTYTYDRESDEYAFTLQMPSALRFEGDTAGREPPWISWPWVNALGDALVGIMDASVEQDMTFGIARLCGIPLKNLDW